MRAAIVVMLSAVACFGAIARVFAQTMPSFCASPGALTNLAEPYARRVAPNGAVYCEGLLPSPIAVHSARIVSAKQEQPQDFRFAPGTRQTLSWCNVPAPSGPTHVRLRALRSPLFALDAEHATAFEWQSDLVARWQPEWHQLAALGTRTMSVGGTPREVVVPIRYGTGQSTSYSFIVQSKTPIQLATALLERDGGALDAVAVTPRAGPVRDTWEVTVSFEKRPAGVVRLTLGERVDQPGVTTEPIYLLHGECSSK